MRLSITDKKLRSAMIFVLTTSILTVSVSPILADENTKKEEVIYVNLNGNGDVSDIYVVNSFDTKGEGNIIDYGNYSSVLNLSTSDELSYSNGMLDTNISPSDETFYYQGNLENNEIPWDINIGYTLDGKNIEAKELAGKSGNLEISLDIKENENINEVFFYNYSLQASLILDGDKCKDIEADGASIANAGSKKAITYMNLPGSENTYTISTNVNDFEMDSISFNAVKMNMVSQFPGGDFTPISYVSEENINVESVQFAMKTDPIQIQEEEIVKEEGEEEESVWQLLLNLFK